MTFEKYSLNDVSARIKRLCIYLIPPVIVFVIMFAMFYVNGMYPFGNRTLSWCDMRQQVLPLLLDFKDILSGKGNMLFNWQNAGGMNFYGVFLFFISSPFSFLVQFVDKTDMSLFMNILTMLKMMVCSLTACIYFKHAFKKLHNFFAVALSVMYAFSGYAMLFYQNTVWLDVMYLFPLLLLSYEALLKKQKIGGFVACLTGMLVLNYYLSYMVVVFTILYFGVYLFMHRKEMLKGVCSLFIIGCAIAAFLSAVIWLPSFAQYLASARGTNIIEGLFYASIPTDIYTDVPLLFCTGIIIPVLIVFRKNICTSTTRFYFAMFVLMTLPIIFEPINKMWHTGNYMSFPVRYGYITTFMALVVVACKLAKIKPRENNGKNNKLCFSICAAVTALVAVGSVWFYSTFEEQLTRYTNTLWGDMNSFLLLFAFTCVIVFVYTFVCYFVGNKKINFKGFAVLLSILVISECVFNVNVYISSATSSATDYQKAIDLSEKIDDEDFYRVKTQEKYFEANLTGGMGYNSLSHYTSLTSQDYMFTMKRLGYSSYWMEVGSNGGTLFSDALLSVRYTIKGLAANDEAIYSNQRYSIVENPYFLPLGIITSSDMSEQKELPALERVPLQEYIGTTLFNQSNTRMFTKYEITELKNVVYKYNEGNHIFKNSTMSAGKISYKINVKGEQTLYLDCFDKTTNSLREPINETFEVYVNGTLQQLIYPNQDTNGLLCLGKFADENVRVTLILRKDVSCASFGLYGLKTESIEKILSSANTAQLKVDGTGITGNCTAKEGDYLYISVPYDSGFKATINGESVEVLQAFSGFMAVKLNAGVNVLQMKYLPRGFNFGLVISFAGIALAIAYILLRKKIVDFCSGKIERVARIGVYGLLIIVLFCIYVAPMLISIVGNMLN